MNAYIVQGVGFVGVVLFIISYQSKSNQILFLCQLFGCVAFCTQFTIMGAYTGAITLLINIVRNILLLNADQRKWVKSKWTLLVILLLLTLMTIITWAGWPSLLPYASVGVTSIGYWTRNAQKIRLSQLFGSPCSLLYDAIIRSWGGVINEALVIISILVSIYRFGWKNLEYETS